MWCRCQSQPGSSVDDLLNKLMKKIAGVSLPRLPKWLVIAVIVLIVVFVGSYIAIGWYFSNKLLVVKPQTVDYDQTVLTASNGKYTLTGSAYDIDGVVGGIRPDGSFIGIFGHPSTTFDVNQSSTRQLAQPKGTLPKAGDKVSLQGNIWTTDPKQALDIDFETVKYDSRVGALEAWVIPSKNSNKWTIAVHGIGGQKQEMLRFVKPVHEVGNTMMVINYRGDTNNPASPDGYTHIGDTEWQDVEAAVRYAKANGATDIQLYASSMGGSLVQNYLRRSTEAKNTTISKVVLDSPALDWEEILNYRVTKMGLPAFISKPGMRVASWRADIDFDRISTKPGSIRHSTLVIHNADDTSVPHAASKRVAEAQPDLVTFVDFGKGGHIRAWNHDSARYERLVIDFLKK